MKLVIMPGGLGHAGSFVEIYRGLLPKGADGFGAVVGTVLANPAFAFKTLLTSDKLVYVLQIATPLAFLPWLRPIGWVCSLPGVLFCLLVTHALPLIEISFQYTPHWTTYLFLALIVNVEWLEHGAQNEAPPRTRSAIPEGVSAGAMPPLTELGTARKHAALATFALCMLLGSHQFGAILQQNTARAGYGAFVFGTTKAQEADYTALRALVAQVPKDARIVASETIVPHVSNRRYAYTLRIGVFDADYLLAVTEGALSDERKRLQGELRGHRFGVVDVRRRFVLMRRGADVRAMRRCCERCGRRSRSRAGFGVGIGFGIGSGLRLRSRLNSSRHDRQLARLTFALARPPSRAVRQQSSPPGRSRGLGDARAADVARFCGAVGQEHDAVDFGGLAAMAALQQELALVAHAFDQHLELLADASLLACRG